MRELFNRVFKKEEGFSLIELIIVIAILAIIAAIAIPNLLSNIQRANEGTDIANAKLIGDAVATVIAQNPELDGYEFDDIRLGSTYAAASEEKAILDLVEASFVSGLPEIKSTRFKGTTAATETSFYITLEASGVILVENDNNVEIYPTPAP
jgi:type IV pilus assembly protein PilA